MPSSSCKYCSTHVCVQPSHDELNAVVRHRPHQGDRGNYGVIKCDIECNLHAARVDPLENDCPVSIFQPLIGEISNGLGLIKTIPAMMSARFRSLLTR